MVRTDLRVDQPFQVVACLKIENFIEQEDDKKKIWITLEGVQAIYDSWWRSELHCCSQRHRCGVGPTCSRSLCKNVGKRFGDSCSRSNQWGRDTFQTGQCWNVSLSWTKCVFLLTILSWIKTVQQMSGCAFGVTWSITRTRTVLKCSSWFSCQTLVTRFLN